MQPATKIPVYILAGGRSSRFGSDKALADLAGEPMIRRVADQWAGWGSRITVVADRAGKYDAAGLATIADLRPALGPIGGLLTALRSAGSGWLLLAACDAMVLDDSFAGRLFSGMTEEAKVIAARGEVWQTIPALYHASILPEVEAAIGQNSLSLWKLIESVPHAAIQYPAGSLPIMQVNTAEDLQRLRSLIGF